jgi:hypothetical protein
MFVGGSVAFGDELPLLLGQTDDGSIVDMDSEVASSVFIPGGNATSKELKNTNLTQNLRFLAVLIACGGE